MHIEQLELWKGLFKSEVRVFEQDVIPCVGQLELHHVPVEIWIIDPDVHGLLDGPCNVVWLPAHNGEAVYLVMIACDAGMVIDGRRSPEMFLKPFPKGPYKFPCVLLITLQPITFKPIYYSTLLCNVFLALRGHQEVLMALLPLKWCSSFELVPKPNGKVRSCLDQARLDQVLIRSVHKEQTLNDVFLKLNNAQYLSLIDVSSGYCNLKLDERSSHLTTFAYQFGKFGYKRLPSGATPEGDMFQRK